MAKMLRRLVRIVPLALLIAGVAIAQGTSSITGVVTDGSTGKPVVGAVVVVTSPALEGEQTAVTEAGGKFTVPNLPAGDYTLAVQFEGYKPFERSDLALKEGTTLRANAAVVPEAVQMEEVVVTGSRIRRKDLTTPAPVAVINTEQIQASGKVSVGDFLQSLPEQGNGINTQTNNGNDGSVNVSLRSLGTQRTLVLVNGRRMVPGGTGAGSTVDLNTIPAAAIERIEILKDGASAVYGSDAIGGVVNVILKRHYTGTEVSGYVGTSSSGDGQTTDISAITGTTGERGSVLFAAGYQEQKKVLAGDRAWSKSQYDMQDADGNETFKNAHRVPVGNSSTFPAGRFRVPSSYLAANCGTATGQLAQVCSAWTAAGSPDDNQTYVPNGGSSGYTVYDGSAYNTNPTNYLITPNKRIQLFSAGEAKMGDSSRAFFEASYVNRQSSTNLAPMPLVNNSIPTMPISVSQYAVSNELGTDITSWRKRTTEFGNRSWKQDLDTFHLVLGVDGTLPAAAGFLEGWTWGVNYNYGRTNGTQTNGGMVRMNNVAAALGPSMVVNGKAVCVATPGDATTVIPGCIPMDVLHGEGNIVTQGNTLADLKRFLSYTGVDSSEYTMQIWSADAAGELFKIGERAVGLAVGADYRMESGVWQPDPIQAASESSGNNADPTSGKYNVKEAYAEVSVPLLSNMPMAEALELSAAARWVKYSSFGANTSFKLGARYTPIQDFTLRGTYSTAFRAPSIAELYSGKQDSYEFASDPTGQDPAAQFLTFWESNKNLKPETARIWTTGLVLEPRPVPNLSFTLDYYYAKVDNEIGLHGTQYLLDKCNEQGPASIYCGYIHRDSDGFVSVIEDQRNNLFKTATSGVDFAARYQLPTHSIGSFGFVLNGTYLISYDDTDQDGVVYKHAGTYDFQTALPRWKANLGASWAFEGLSAAAEARYVGTIKECLFGTCSDPTYNHAAEGDETRTVSAYLPVDLSLGYSFETGFGKTALLGSIQNVFNTNPPYIFNAVNFNSDPNTYDYAGRYYSIRLTQSF
jgi:iron complex outermembrane recepter protein